MKLAQTPPALLIAASLGCGGSPTGPTEVTLEFATVTPVGSTCGSGASAVYFVTGLSGYVRDPGPTPLEAVMRVGETAHLLLHLDGRGAHSSEAWTSTNPTTVALQEGPEGSAFADLTALAPGETEVYVEFEGPDDRRHRTYAAYCPTSVYLCVSPRRPIVRLRVVAP